MGALADPGYPLPLRGTNDDLRRVLTRQFIVIKKEPNRDGQPSVSRWYFGRQDGVEPASMMSSFPSGVWLIRSARSAKSNSTPRILGCQRESLKR